MPLVTLDQLGPGMRGVIVRIEGGPGLVRKLNLMGFTPGTTVEVVTSYRGPILVRVRGTVVAIGRGVARRILVETK